MFIPSTVANGRRSVPFGVKKIQNKMNKWRYWLNNCWAWELEEWNIHARDGMRWQTWNEEEFL